LSKPKSGIPPSGNRCGNRLGIGVEPDAFAPSRCPAPTRGGR
jgi:hypothetical protein